MTNQSIPLYTIGYGSRTIDEFIAALKQQDIAFLIDVRSAPYSRHKPEFSKEPLEQALNAAQIRYVFMGDTLGGRPEDRACYTDDKPDYAKMAETPAYQQGIARLQTAFAQQQRVVLMCAEGKPEQCHRTHLIGASLTELAIPVMHIDETGTLLDQSAVIARQTATASKAQKGDSASTLQQPLLADDLGNEKSDAAQSATVDEPPDFPPLPDFDEEPPAGLWDDFAVDDEWQAPPPSTTSLAPIQQYESAHGALSQVFGYETFRPLQEEIITNILAQRDTLVIMPTGGGKSLCYQLPALLFDGLTLVVSPLIALMQDQVAALQSAGVAAAFLNSTLAAVDYHATLQAAKQGQLKLLYMAPETLLRPDILATLQASNLQLLAIDEAHCVSQWGHDFRPEYRQLVTVRQRFPDAVCVALTATATPRVQEDIKQSLGFRDENEFVSSFDRQNLFIGVESKLNIAEQVIEFLRAHADQSGIVYCSTQKKVEDLAATLNANDIKALPYHGGMDSASRHRNQRAFMVDDVPVMVATIAFGMGVDKPDVRFVLHVDLPQDVESYYQQIGRAGRDGERADCLLLFGYGDVHTIQHFIRQGAASEADGRLHRLQTMVNWAETNDCRRRDLLGYFGQRYMVENCEMCDNCVQPEQELVDLTIPAQKFLSCVIRTGERFGQGHIINVLRGSQAQNIRKWNHDQLSTHGIGQEHSDATWKYLVNQFMQQDLLVRDLHGGLAVSEKGRAVLRGEQVWGTLQEERLQRMSGGDALPANYEIALFEQLRNERKRLADAEDVPPYMIFADRSLQEMATYLPHTPESFGTMHGVGQAKVARFAEIFLPIIVAYCRERDLEERPKQGKAKVVRVGTMKSRADEVGELFYAGHSLDQIANHFNVKRQTVVNNLAKYIDGDNLVDMDRLIDESTLDSAQQQAILAAFDEHGAAALRPIFEALGGKVEYDEIHLWRVIYRLRGMG